MATEKKSNRDGKYWVVILLTLFGVLSAGYNIHLFRENRQKDKEVINVARAIADTTIRMYKTKDSLSIATINLLESSNVNLLKKIAINSVSLEELALLVTKYEQQIKKGGSVTRFRSETTIQTEGKPLLIWVDSTTGKKYIDTLPIGYTDTSIYKGYIEDMEVVKVFVMQDSTKWFKYRIDYNFGDNISKLDLTTYNAYTAIIGYEKGKPIVTIANDNPFSSVKQLRAYKVTGPKQKKFGLGISIGAALTKDFKFTPYAGVGLNYNLIEF